jgi:hypothetical protein
LLLKTLIFIECCEIQRGTKYYEQADLNHFPSSDVPTPSSTPGITNHASSPLDDDITDSSDSNFNWSSFNASNSFGAAVSNFNGSFNSSHPNLVLYSSDVNISPGHGAQQAFNAANPGSGATSGSTTTTVSTDSVKWD